MVFIDFHGTLCHDLFWRSLPGEHQARIQSFLARDGHAMLTPWMRGELSAEAVNHKVAEATGMPFQSVWASFVRECETMHIQATALKAIDRLRQDAVVLLVTDNMDCFSRFTVPALGLDRHFDGISNSSETGILKADGNGAIFRQLAEHWGMHEDACTLLDDSADACANVTAMGGRAIRIERRGDLDLALQHLLSPP